MKTHYPWPEDVHHARCVCPLCESRREELKGATSPSSARHDQQCWCAGCAYLRAEQLGQGPHSPSCCCEVCEPTRPFELPRSPIEHGHGLRIRRTDVEPTTEELAEVDRLMGKAPAGKATCIDRKDFQHGVDWSPPALVPAEVGQGQIGISPNFSPADVNQHWNGKRWVRPELTPEPLTRHSIACPTCRRVFCEVMAPASWAKFAPVPICPGCEAEGRR